MINKINIVGFDCHVAFNGKSEWITYLIYPALVPFEDKWLEKMSENLKMSLVAVYVPADLWNDVLTPWPEPGETKDSEPFGGKAESFLKLLQEKIIPKVEKEFNVTPKERNLMGVSLGGLFTLWEWTNCPIFNNIACLSGSFWYIGFIEWFDKLTDIKKTGSAYFLLGEEEPHAHVKAFRSVGVNTEEIVKKLRAWGINVVFDWVQGNHFSDPVGRAEKGLKALAEFNSKE